MRYLTFTIVCMGGASCAFESARVPDFDFFHVSDSKEWIAVKSLPPDVLGNMKRNLHNHIFRPGRGNEMSLSSVADGGASSKSSEWKVYYFSRNAGKWYCVVSMLNANESRMRISILDHQGVPVKEWLCSVAQ